MLRKTAQTGHSSVGKALCCFRRCRNILEMKRFFGKYGSEKSSFASYTFFFLKRRASLIREFRGYYVHAVIELRRFQNLEGCETGLVGDISWNNVRPE